MDSALQTAYEQTMSEWLAVEAIVRQRDKEIMAANLAKLSSESQDGQIPLVRKDSSLSNDVFISQSFDSDDFSHPETLPEESSTAMTTPTPEHRLSLETCINVTTPDLLQTDTDDMSPRETKMSSGDSPDDGLGDSIARQSSLATRSKLGSAADSEATDAGRSEMGSLTDRSIIVTKSSVDSAGVDDYFSGAECTDDMAVGESTVPMNQDTEMELSAPESLGMEGASRSAELESDLSG